MEIKDLPYKQREIQIARAASYKEEKMKKEERMTRETYYLTVLEAVRQRSTCDRGKAGAIIVKEGRIITTGYVGAPTGMPHCEDNGHLIEFHSPEPGFSPGLTKHCIRTVHAELNAILQAADFGISIRGATMYCTMFPCFECAKAIVNVGIKEIIAVHLYQTQQWGILLFREVGLPYRILNQEKLY